MGVILNKPDLSGYMTVEDYQTDEEVVAAALNDLNGRIKTVENADYATTLNNLNSRITTVENADYASQIENNTF